MANAVIPRSTPRSLAIAGDRPRPGDRGVRLVDDEPERRRPATPRRRSLRRRWRPAEARPHRRATRGPAASIEYSIWGDPAEIDSQTKLVESFEAVNPTIDVKVTVADWDTYWDKLLTGLSGGAAPDVFAMDGPLFPDYQARDVLLDLAAVRDPRRVRPRTARRPGRRRLQDGGRRPVRPAARPQRHRALLQQGDVRRGRDPLPRRHVGLGQARRGREAVDQGRRRRRQGRPVGPLHRDLRHGELLAVAGLAERRRRSSAPMASRRR